MATYDTESAKIKRQRMIADALRASGNEALPASIQTGGRFDAAVSPWQYASKALQTVLGAVNARQADQAEAKLSAQDKAQLAELLQAKAGADRPDDPDGLDEVVPLEKPTTQKERKAQLQAAAIRGQQFGGSAAPYAEEITKRELFPAPYNLSADETRFENNVPVAVGLPKTVPEHEGDRQLINIEDGKGGYKTIKRADWKGEKLYEKPAAANVVANQLSGNALDFAAETYRQTGKLPTGLGRSPQASLKIIQRAAELAAANGDTAQAAVLRQHQQKAAQAALSQLTKQQTMVGAFEKTAMNSLKIAQDLSGKVSRAGVPVFDRWVQAGRKKLAGDPDVASFHAANETFISEYAKIMSGSMGNTVVSDSARQHAREILEPAMTKEQYDGVVGTLKQEMDGRIASFPAQAAELMGMLGATDGTPTPGAAPAAGGPPKIASDEEYDKLPSGTKFIDPEGNERTKP